MKTGRVNPDQRGIKVMMLHVNCGLEFPVLVLVGVGVGVGHMPTPSEDEREEARLFYVGATRAMERLVIWVTEDGKFAARL